MDNPGSPLTAAEGHVKYLLYKAGTDRVRTYKEAGRLLGLTPERIRQYDAKIRRKLQWNILHPVTDPADDPRGG